MIWLLDAVGILHKFHQVDRISAMEQDQQIAALVALANEILVGRKCVEVTHSLVKNILSLWPYGNFCEILFWYVLILDSAHFFKIPFDILLTRVPGDLNQKAADIQWYRSVLSEFRWFRIETMLQYAYENW